jgi:hypothetical protein
MRLHRKIAGGAQARDICIGMFYTVPSINSQSLTPLLVTTLRAQEPSVRQQTLARCRFVCALEDLRSQSPRRKERQSRFRRTAYFATGKCPREHREPDHDSKSGGLVSGRGSTFDAAHHCNFPKRVAFSKDRERIRYSQSRIVDTLADTAGGYPHTKQVASPRCLPRLAVPCGQLAKTTKPVRRSSTKRRWLRCLAPPRAGAEVSDILLSRG